MAFDLGASTDRFEFGSPAALDNIIRTGGATILGWIRFTASPAASWVAGKANATTGWQLFVPGADTTTLRLDHPGTTDLNISSATGWISANTWQFFAITTNIGVADPEFHYGTLTAAAVQEGTPVIQQQGVSLVDDSTYDFMIGDQSAKAFWSSAAMQVGPFAIYNRVLTLGEIINWQFRPRVIGSDCKLFIHPGFHGAAACPDLSGGGSNATSFTSISLAAHPPLGPFFGHDVELPYAVAATTTTSTTSTTTTTTTTTTTSSTASTTSSTSSTASTTSSTSSTASTTSSTSSTTSSTSSTASTTSSTSSTASTTSSTSSTASTTSSTSTSTTTTTSSTSSTASTTSSTSSTASTTSSTSSTASTSSTTSSTTSTSSTASTSSTSSSTTSTTTTAPSIATNAIHIFSDNNTIEPNHATDNSKSVLIKDGLEVQGDVWAGGATNYSQLDSNGNHNLFGNANVIFQKASGNGIKIDPASADFGWADIIGDQFAKNTGGTKPTLATYNGAVNSFQFAAGDEAYLTFHMPHDYVPGTDIYIHVHWSHTSTLVTGGSLTFKLTSIYSKGHNQAAFGAPVSGTFTSNASTTQYQHIIEETQYSASSPAGLQLDTDDLEIDGVIEVTFEVDANNITSSGAVPDPFIHYVDIHYQSTGIGTKQKAPDFYT